MRYIPNIRVIHAAGEKKKVEKVSKLPSSDLCPLYSAPRPPLPVLALLDSLGLLTIRPTQPLQKSHRRPARIVQAIPSDPDGRRELAQNRGSSPRRRRRRSSPITMLAIPALALFRVIGARYPGAAAGRRADGREIVVSVLGDAIPRPFVRSRPTRAVRTQLA
jgi:hypothetical protein